MELLSESDPVWSCICGWGCSGTRPTICSAAPGSRRRVRGCTGLSSCWFLVVFILMIRLIGSLVEFLGAVSASVVSAMRLYWLALAVLYCKMGLSGVTVPLGLVLGRLLVSHFLASAM